MNDITKKLIDIVTGTTEPFKGAYSIRENGVSIACVSSENIRMEKLEGGKGLAIYVSPNTKGEKVYIPACITKGNVTDKVYNDFYIGENCDVTVVAGCGVHSEDHEKSIHNGIHRFFIGENAKVVYEEQHVGTGKEESEKEISPVTEIFMKKNSYLEMNATQLKGVNYSSRKTTAELDEGAKLIVKERLLTVGEEYAESFYKCSLNGEGSSVNLISRSVAEENSVQKYFSEMLGNAPCSGHSECDAIIMGNAQISATPALYANNTDAALVHEAAIGKIAGEQIDKLKTLGLTAAEAEAVIIEGFLK